MVRSKSEVIVANLLTAKDIAFEYEVPLFAPDGTFYLPDFTIEWRGQRYFWSISECWISRIQIALGEKRGVVHETLPWSAANDT